MNHRNSIGIWTQRVVFILLAAVLSLVLVGLLLSPPGSQLTPAGIKRNTSSYITMRDGVKIAVDVWLPADLSPGQRVPALLRFTRYTRALESGFIRRVAQGLGLDGVHPVLQLFFDSGYAVIEVDSRGSGASSGTRTAEISPAEVADMAEVVDWVILQSWSTGEVGAFGVSYIGTTSEMLAVNAHPAVKAVVPLFSDFDGYTGLVNPGGVFAEKFVHAWGLGNHYSDSNDPCRGGAGIRCWLTKLWVTGIKPVDGDTGGLEVDEVVRQRNNYDVEAAMKALVHIDDPLGEGDIGDVFPAGHREAISASKVPMRIWVSWLDAATVDGAIARYNSFSNPQQLVIAPFNHGGSKNTDPFSTEDAPARPSRLQQYQEHIAFLDGFLKGDESALPSNLIRYYTLGEGEWKETDVWPPEGVGKRRWYFNANQRLTESAPDAAEASDSYKINYRATTGVRNRWLGQLGGGRDIVYPDRAEQDKKLLIYDSEPMQVDTEITGAPVVTLQLDSTHSDGAFHVYFEDVAPDGSVTYITEGILRAKHRKVSADIAPYYIEGPYHSLKREDAMPLLEGEVTELQIGLITTSVLIKTGHRLRIAIGGHDASVFERIPETGTPVIKIHRSRSLLSFVEFPVVANRDMK